MAVPRRLAETLHSSDRNQQRLIKSEVKQTWAHKITLSLYCIVTIQLVVRVSDVVASAEYLSSYDKGDKSADPPVRTTALSCTGHALLPTSLYVLWFRRLSLFTAPGDLVDIRPGIIYCARGNRTAAGHVNVKVTRRVSPLKASGLFVSVQIVTSRFHLFPTIKAIFISERPSTSADLVAGSDLRAKWVYNQADDGHSAVLANGLTHIYSLYDLDQIYITPTLLRG
ncbi:hypothetical protein J6590_058782 [Homalodisca vitripennis]|nr:hypothetical protein J6590_058782 [Homalodisca vitripennis]